MDVLVDFLLNNYIWFLIISLILIFALIGYLVDSTTPKIKEEMKNSKNNLKFKEEETTLKVHPSVEIYTNEKFDEPLIDDQSVN